MDSKSVHVVMYSTGCPKCNVLKKKMEAKGIEYEENNSVDEMTLLGITHVPVLFVDENRMEFSEANQWINAQ